jgi:hypothetical protein
VIASTAAWNAAWLALDGFLKPLTLRTNCNEASRISASLAGGSKLKSGLIFLHMGISSILTRYPLRVFHFPAGSYVSRVTPVLKFFDPVSVMSTGFFQIVEQAFSTSKDDRRDQELVSIDEVIHNQHPDKPAAAGNQDILAGLLLYFRDCSSAICPEDG